MYSIIFFLFFIQFGRLRSIDLIGFYHYHISWFVERCKEICQKCAFASKGQVSVSCPTVR